MSYATGKFSYGLCDYCGQRYLYSELKKNWRGFKVCPADYEAKEPQLEPLKYRGDAIALYQPRPEPAEPLTVFVGPPGDSAFMSVGMQPAPVAQVIVGVGLIGTVTVTT
jgi:hypothetical protein